MWAFEYFFFHVTARSTKNALLGNLAWTSESLNYNADMQNKMNIKRIH